MNIIEQNCMNDCEQVEIFERYPLMESLLTIEILSTNDVNYKFTNVGMGNYYLCENVYPILISIEKEHKVLIMFIDGARCKHVCSASVIFKSPKGHIKRFSFRFIWIALIILMNMKLCI